MEDDLPTEVPLEPLPIHPPAPPLDRVQDVDAGLDHVGDDLPDGPVAVEEHVHPVVVGEVHHPLHPGEEELAYHRWRHQEPRLGAEVLGHVAEGDLAGDLLVDPLRALVAEVEHLVEAVVHDVGVEEEIEESLLLTPQILVIQEGLGAPSPYWETLPSIQFVWYHRKVVHLDIGPLVVALYLSDRLVLSEGVVDALPVGASPVSHVPVSAAEDVRILGDGRSDVLRLHAYYGVDVQAPIHLNEALATEVAHQHACDFVGGPVVHGDPVWFPTPEDGEPTLLGRHRLFEHPSPPHGHHQVGFLAS